MLQCVRAFELSPSRCWRSREILEHPLPMLRFGYIKRGELYVGVVGEASVEIRPRCQPVASACANSALRAWLAAVTLALLASCVSLPSVSRAPRDIWVGEHFGRELAFDAPDGDVLLNVHLVVIETGFGSIGLDKRVVRIAYSVERNDGRDRAAHLRTYRETSEFEEIGGYRWVRWSAIDDVECECCEATHGGVLRSGGRGAATVE